MSIGLNRNPAREVHARTLRASEVSRGTSVQNMRASRRNKTSPSCCCDAPFLVLQQTSSSKGLSCRSLQNYSPGKAPPRPPYDGAKHRTDCSANSTLLDRGSQRGLFRNPRVKPNFKKKLQHPSMPSSEGLRRGASRSRYRPPRAGGTAARRRNLAQNSVGSQAHEYILEATNQNMNS